MQRKTRFLILPFEMLGTATTGMPKGLCSALFSQPLANWFLSKQNDLSKGLCG